MALIPRGLNFLSPNRSLTAFFSLVDNDLTLCATKLHKANNSIYRKLVTASASHVIARNSVDNRRGAKTDFSPRTFLCRYSSAIPRPLVKEGEPRLKQDALDIYYAGLEAVEPKSAVDHVLSRRGNVLRFLAAKSFYVLF